MQKHRLKTILIYTFLLSAAGCGRKQKNFFSFSQKEQQIINKLDLPAVKGVNVQKTNLGIHISWLPLFSEKTPPHIGKFKDNFLGFNVFRLENNAMFIPKNSINKKLITVNYYIDTDSYKKDSPSYTIQPVFRFSNKIIYGPSSQIIKVHN